MSTLPGSNSAIVCFTEGTSTGVCNGVGFVPPQTVVLGLEPLVIQRAAIAYTQLQGTDVGLATVCYQLGADTNCRNTGCRVACQRLDWDFASGKLAMASQQGSQERTVLPQALTRPLPCI